MSLKNFFMEALFYFFTPFVLKIENNMASRLKVMLATEFIVIGLIAFMVSILFQFLLLKLSIMHSRVASFLIYLFYIAVLIKIINPKYTTYFIRSSFIFYFFMTLILLFLLIKIKGFLNQRDQV